VKLRFLIALFIFLLPFVSNAKDQRITDSLKTVIETAKEDSTKINALIRIAWEFSNHSSDTAIFFSKQALGISEENARSSDEHLVQIGKKGMAGSLHSLGVFHYLKGNYHIALDHYNKSLIVIVIVMVLSVLIALGRFKTPPRLIEGLAFLVFLLFFEFTLVLLDPTIEKYSAGAPAIKLLFNAGIAAFIFPLHSFFETKLKARFVKS